MCTLAALTGSKTVDRDEGCNVDKNAIMSRIRGGCGGYFYSTDNSSKLIHSHSLNATFTAILA